MPGFGFKYLKLFFFLSIISIGPLANSESFQYDLKNPVFEKVTEEKPICFARVYSEKHLMHHPLQTVKLIKAQLEYIREYDQRNLTLKISLKNNPRKEYTANFTCFGESHCGIDCDGGSIDLLKGKHGGIRIVNHGITLESDCGNQNEKPAQQLYLNDTRSGDDVFDLVPFFDKSECF